MGAVAAQKQATAMLLLLFNSTRALAGVAAGGSEVAAVIEAVRPRAATTPGVRVVVVRIELRRLVVELESRLVAVAHQQRQVAPAAERRTILVPPETRSITA